MAAFFTIGEKKIRPGVYYRYENYGTSPTAGADDGKCACVIRSNWGPTEVPVLLESYEEISTYFGDGGDSGTLAVPLEQFKGGAKTVRAIRVGTGGSKGSVTLCDEDGTEVLKLFLKYVGARALSVTLRPTLEDETLYELLILEGTTQLEQITFTNDLGEKSAWDLAEAIGGSAYVTCSVLTVTESSLATVEQVEITGGTDPVVDVEAYSNAFVQLENYRWNVLALDTEDLAVQMMAQLYLNRLYQEGNFVMGVIGESTSVDFDTRLSHASAFNDYQMVYVGNGFVDMAGDVYEGYLAAARISGLIAGTPSNESITRLAVSGATDLTEYLSNSQYELAITAGMLTFSVSSANTVWVEQGVNTLVLPSSNQDIGWKKIKRTKVRFELMQRLNDTVEPLIGRVNNDPDGRMTIIQMSNAVCNTMVAEKKLLSGARVELDPDNTPEGDSAWFLVYADDIDALEKMYYNFKFRFAPDEE